MNSNNQLIESPSAGSFEHPANLTLLIQLGLIDSSSSSTDALLAWRALTKDPVVAERARIFPRHTKYPALIRGAAYREVVERMTKPERAKLRERLHASTEK